MKLYSSAYHVWLASMKQAAIGENATPSDQEGLMPVTIMMYLLVVAGPRSWRWLP